MPGYYPVTILAFEHSMEMSIVMAKDMFYAGSTAFARIHDTQPSGQKQVVVASQSGAAIKTFNGSLYRVDLSINDVTKTDLVIISGVWGDVDKLIASSQEIINWVRQQHRAGAKVACLHSGTFILAETGLLDGKVATIYWRMIDAFKQRYPEVILQSEKKITSAGNLYCSSGITSAVELATYLLEKLWGMTVAEKVSRNFLMDIPRADPASYLALTEQKEHGDLRIHKAQQWMESHFSSGFVMEEVAKTVGLSLRSFRRRFKDSTGETPMQYLHRIRLETAKNLFTSSTLTIEQIAYRVGFKDANYFSRLFRSKFGVTPSHYRRTSGGQ